MERAAALKKLSKLLGKKACYRIDRKAPGPNERAAARAALPDALAERNRLVALCDKRRDEILAENAEYQKLVTECRNARAKLDKISSIARHFKISVGLNESLFFHVSAEADSWEEIFAKLERKKEPA